MHYFIPWVVNKDYSLMAIIIRDRNSVRQARSRDSVLRRVWSQSKEITSLDGTDSDAASTIGLRPLKVSLPEFNGRSDSERRR